MKHTDTIMSCNINFNIECSKQIVVHWNSEFYSNVWKQCWSHDIL